MSFRGLRNGLALSVSLAASSFSHAQAAQIPVLGGLLTSLGSLPIIGALPLDALTNPAAGLDGLSGAGLPGLDALPLPGLEALPDVLGNIGSGGLPGLDSLPLVGVLGIGGMGGAGAGDVPGLSDLLEALPLLSSETPQLPGVDALLSILNGLGTGGLPGADFLPLAQIAAVGTGDLSIPGLDAIIDIPALADYATLAKVEMAVGAVEGFITGVVADPQSLTTIGSGLGPDALFAVVPLLGALKDDPASLATYFSDGGTILSAEIELLPPIPVVSQPLAL
jgi:hypothetical protein